MTPPDLDALEKLADEALLPMPDKRRTPWFNRQRRFSEAAHPATIKALIAELKEARGLIVQSLNGLALETVDDFALRNRLQAFLARNGKGEG